ncbi:hypothetical protein [Chitinimonas sp. BJYL2]|uniref:hypothetical protein n=1 Tax=Chitinimonas sp. BJYL2 TaxID=2976696 RepID=UPI0022B4521D|nr:hypothetical protein [Chitinimonas sp. BJYL2]
MTNTHEKKTDRAAIAVSFDLEQNTQQLTWRMESEHHRDIYQVTGRAAGSVLLDPTEPIDVLITAGGKLKTFGAFRFEIVQCCVVTTPHVIDSNQQHGRQFAPPSPFVGQGSVRVVTPDFWQLHEEVDKDGYRRYVLLAKDVLYVGVAPGRWELSVFLTVRISSEQGTLERTFRFDPESEVGNGTQPN